MDTAKLLWVLLLLVVSLIIVESVNDHALDAVEGDEDMTILCIEKERQALLRFKQGFTNDYGVLASWDDEDCCKWDGIRCSNTSHHVIALQIEGNSRYLLNGSLSYALLDLHHLQILKLSRLHLMERKIPSFIGSLEKLEHLILEWCELSGDVPSQLGNLTKLKTLNLRSNFGLKVNNLDWLHHLPLLSHLDLTHTKVGDPNWLQVISSLPSLKELTCGVCNLYQLTPSTMRFSVNSSFPSLAKVDFSDSTLNSLIYSWLFNMSHSLVSIDLSFTHLDGLIPEEFGNFILLEYLHMSNNRYEGEIPNSFVNLSNLNFLDLSYNKLTGYLSNKRWPFSLRELLLNFNEMKGILNVEQLPKLEILDVSFNSFEGTFSQSHLSNLHNLQVLDLSFNSLSLDTIPIDWIPPCQLVSLKLANCNLGPQFPKWIQNQNNLSILDLSNNEISGHVPRWLWDTSPRLEYLNLSNNQLSGSIPDMPSKFVGFPRIDLSFNKLSGILPLFHPNLSLLQLSTNMFTGSISSICPYENLVMLVLSNNQFSDEFPQCLMNMPKLTILDLANNTLWGSILNSPVKSSYLPVLEVLVLRNNNLSGELPPNLIYNKFYLAIIDVGGNQLTGNVRTWIENRYLKVLILRDNKFYGMIPRELCHLNKIRILDLSENNMTGRIPWCFSNFTSLAQRDETFETLLPLSWTSWSDSLYFDNDWYIENALVNWKGTRWEYKQNARFLKLIDLSDNKLEGHIPKGIFHLRELISLNLSANHLTGSIDSSIGQMKQLECLDLSGNHLSGEIPLGLAQLSSLSVLDLSNNNLSGRIPLGTQLQGFNASSYSGNNKLCGPPLVPCPLLSGPHISLNEIEEHKYYLDNGFYICAATGFVTGFWGVIVVVFFYTSWWRNCAMINCWSKMWDWVYVRAAIHIRILK